MIEQNKFFDPAPDNGGSPQQKKQNSGFWKYMGIGCLGIIILIVIGSFFAYRGIKGFVSGVTEKYTNEQPITLPAVDVSEYEASMTLNRVDAFTSKLNRGVGPEPLILTSRDINVLICKHPEWKDMVGKVYVTIEDDSVNGLISFPLKELGGMFKGRYLNGSATFIVSMAAGRLLVFLDSAEVGGRPLPDEFMNAIRGENLAKEANNDSEVTAILEKLESISVKNGSLIIIPKQH